MVKGLEYRRSYQAGSIGSASFCVARGLVVSFDRDLEEGSKLMREHTDKRVTATAARSDDAGESARPIRISGWKRFCFRILLLGGVLAVCIGILEAGLWIFAPIPYSEWLVYVADGHIRARPMPNQIIKNIKGAEVRINKWGFRGPDHAFEREPGTLRLIVFAGSAGFCYRSASIEKSWPGAIEVKLQSRLQMPVEVINLSVPGFDSFHSKQNYLCWGRAFEPDAIIVYHTWNDMKNFRFLAGQPYQPMSWVPNKPLWQRIARATQTGRRARNIIWRWRRVQMENTYAKREGTSTQFDAPIDPKALEWERRNFTDFVVLARSDGVLPILVSQAGLAAPENIKGKEIKLALAPTPKSSGMTVPLMVETWRRVNEIVEEVARDDGAIFVDGFNQVPHDLEHFRDHVHLEDAGSDVLAETIVSALLTEERFQGLVDRVRMERPSASSGQLE